MSGGIYGGDEVGALIFDIGNHSLRAGYAGEDSPKADIPTTVGIWEDSDQQIDVDSSQNISKRYNIGTSAINVVKRGMNMVSFLRDGLIEDWDMFERVVEYTYNKCIHADATHHPLLMSEAPWNSLQKRENLTELMFEKFNVPAFYVAKSAQLVAFCNGRSVGVVLDSGATHTSAIPMYDGHVVTSGIARTPLGGDFISNQCQKFLEDQNIDIVPRYMIAKKEAVREMERAKYTRHSGHTLVSATWHRYMVKDMIQDFKTNVLQIAESPYDDELVNQMPLVHYEFPNGYHQDFGAERFQIPETLFDPSKVEPLLFGAAQLISSAVSLTDIDIRPSLYGTVIVTGGNSLIQGFTERLSRDLLAKSPPSLRMKVISSNSSVERKYGSWIGGSILASLGSFQQQWMSREEYDECGKNLVEKRCP